MATASMPPPPFTTKPPSSSISSPSYESFAPRSQSQRDRLSQIESLTSGPTFGPSSTAAVGSFLVSALSPPSFPLLSSTNNSTPDPITSTLSNALSTSNHLTSILHASSLLTASLTSSKTLSEELSSRHSNLLKHSSELSTAAEQLQAQESVLSQRALEIGLPLKHYDAIDRIGITVGVLFKDKGRTVVRGLASVKAGSPEYVKMLGELDDAVDFFSDPENDCSTNLVPRGMEEDGTERAEVSGAEAEYLKRGEVLRDAALYLLREGVVDRLLQTGRDVMSVLDLPKVVILAERLEASLVYTRFHGISSRSRDLIGILRERKERAVAYRDLLELCKSAYCQTREGLLRVSIRAHMDLLREEHGLVGMTRLASLFLMRLCTVETQLYLDFFCDATKVISSTEKEEVPPASPQPTYKQPQPKKKDPKLESQARIANSDPIFQKTLSNLCQNLHRTVRRGLIAVHDLDTLCQIVSVLREERSHANSSRMTLAAARAIGGVIQDSQERLIFCAQKSLHQEVVRFRPSPQDLDYPNKLTSSVPIATANTDTNTDDPLQAQLTLYQSWFPPIRSILKILSKIFRVVEPSVFEDIALTAVQSCIKTLKDAAHILLLKQGVIHSHLFLVKYLLILREQLSPFDIQLRAVERQLDFSTASQAVTKFLANRNRRLFSMTTQNALVTLLREGVSVAEANVDSKRDLEDALRSACNDFIERTFYSLAKPLVNFVTACKSAGDASSIDPNTTKSMLTMVKDNIGGGLSTVEKEMEIYLNNKATQGILLKPVVRKIVMALEEAKGYVEAVEEQGGWEVEGVKTDILELMKDIEKEVAGKKELPGE